VNVKEEFTAADHTGSLTLTHNDRTTVLNGPRRYLNVSLEPVDEFGTGQSIMLRPPVGRPMNRWSWRAHRRENTGFMFIRLAAIPLRFVRARLTCSISRWWWARERRGSYRDHHAGRYGGDQRHGRRRRAAGQGTEALADAEPGACLLHSSGG